MARLPRHKSLVEQVAAILRSDIAKGRWHECLPGEHVLCDELQVSRSTLRAALDILRREKALRVSQGRRRQITRPGKAVIPAHSTTITVVSTLPLQQLSTYSIIAFHELRRHLQALGFELQLQVLNQTTKTVGSRYLELITRQTPSACWILSSCSKNVQQWFQSRNLSAIVLGSCHTGVDLPYFRLDVVAVSRHAVRELHRQGHRRLGLLLPQSPYAGTLEVEACFHETSFSFRESELVIPIVRYHTGGIDNVTRVLSSLMTSESSPTALLVMMAGDALTAHGYLQSHGRQPEDVSLISLFDDHYLNSVTPPFGRYCYNHATYARRLTNQIIRYAKSGLRPRSISIIPSFVPGIRSRPKLSG